MQNQIASGPGIPSDVIQRRKTHYNQTQEEIEAERLKQQKLAKTELLKRCNDLKISNLVHDISQNFYGYYGKREFLEKYEHLVHQLQLAKKTADDFQLREESETLKTLLDKIADFINNLTWIPKEDEEKWNNIKVTIISFIQKPQKESQLSTIPKVIAPNTSTTPLEQTLDTGVKVDEAFFNYILFLPDIGISILKELEGPNLLKLKSVSKTLRTFIDEFNINYASSGNKDIQGIIELLELAHKKLIRNAGNEIKTLKKKNKDVLNSHGPILEKLGILKTETSKLELEDITRTINQAHKQLQNNINTRSIELCTQIDKSTKTLASYMERRVRIYLETDKELGKLLMQIENICRAIDSLKEKDLDHKKLSGFLALLKNMPAGDYFTNSLNRAMNYSGKWMPFFTTVAAILCVFVAAYLFMTLPKFSSKNVTTDVERGFKLVMGAVFCIAAAVAVAICIGTTSTAFCCNRELPYRSYNINNLTPEHAVIFAKLLKDYAEQLTDIKTINQLMDKLEAMLMETGPGLQTQLQILAKKIAGLVQKQIDKSAAPLTLAQTLEQYQRDKKAIRASFDELAFKHNIWCQKMTETKREEVRIEMSPDDIELNDFQKTTETTELLNKNSNGNPSYGTTGLRMA